MVYTYLGKTAIELKLAGYTVSTLLTYGFPLQELVKAEYKLSDLLSANCNPYKLVEAGMKLSEFKLLGILPGDIVKVNVLLYYRNILIRNYPVSENPYVTIYDNNGKVALVVTATAINSSDNLWKGSVYPLKRTLEYKTTYTPSQNLIMQYAITLDTEIQYYHTNEPIWPINSNVILGQQRGAATFKFSNIITVKSLIDANYTLSEIKTAEFPMTELKKYFTLRELKLVNFTLEELKLGNFTATKLYNSGYSLDDLKNALFTVRELKDTKLFLLSELKNAGFTTKELFIGGYSLNELHNNNFTASEMKIAGFTSRELQTAGYSAKQLVEAGYNLVNPLPSIVNKSSQERNIRVPIEFSILANYVPPSKYTVSQLKIAGYTASQLLNAGYTLVELKNANFTVKELVSAGYRLKQLKLVGFTALELSNAGYSDDDLRQGGVSEEKIIEANKLFVA